MDIPRLRANHIFGEERPFAQCHASTLVQLPDGQFLVAWFGGTREGHPDVGIWGSTGAGAHWSRPIQLVKVDARAHWNPVLFHDASGLLHLFFKVGAVIDDWETWIMTSSDNGQTWGHARELVPGDRGGRGPVKNKPILLRSGAWLAPASVEKKNVWRVMVDRSEDEGRTWKSSGLLPLDSGAISGVGVIQPTLWESTPGCVHMLMRSSGGWICRSDSRDDGRTWSTIDSTTLPNNNSGIDLARLADGTLALVYNPVEGNNGVRTPLRLSFSRDNGLTWPYSADLENEPGEFSYPAIIPVGNGVALTYTWQRQRIAFWEGTV